MRPPASSLEESRARREREQRENGQVSIEEAEKLGIKFTNSGTGPPKFKNERKKKNTELIDDNRYYFDDPAVDESSENARPADNKGEKKNLREIINMEK